MGGPARRTGRQNRTNGGCEPACLMATLTPMHAVCTGPISLDAGPLSPWLARASIRQYISLTGWGHMRGVRLADVDE